MPSGYVLLAKPAFVRSEFQKPYDVKTYYFNFIRHPGFNESFNDFTTNLKAVDAEVGSYKVFDISVKGLILQNLVNISDSL